MAKNVYNKDGRLSVYGLCCGYYEVKPLKCGRGCAKLHHEGGIYHVDTAGTRKSFHSICEARAYFDDLN
jgi:hypothetical protein